jgi:phi13 family phage major tail protein
MADTQEFFEFRGVSDLFIAEVLTDDEEGMTFGTPERLTFVQEVGQTKSVSTETHWFDNMPMNTVTVYGNSEVTITGAPISLEMESKITGNFYDPETGMLVDGDKVQKKFATIYKTKGTDGKFRYVTYLKGTFTIGDVSHKTEDDGTETTLQELTYTSLKSNHKFAKGGNTNYFVLDERANKLDFSKFFEAVITPDTAATLLKTAE